MKHYTVKFDIVIPECFYVNAESKPKAKQIAIDMFIKKIKKRNSVLDIETYETGCDNTYLNET